MRQLFLLPRLTLRSTDRDYRRRCTDSLNSIVTDGENENGRLTEHERFVRVELVGDTFPIPTELTGRGPVRRGNLAPVAREHTGRCVKDVHSRLGLNYHGCLYSFITMA